MQSILSGPTLIKWVQVFYAYPIILSIILFEKDPITLKPEEEARKKIDKCSNWDNNAMFCNIIVTIFITEGQR